MILLATGNEVETGNAIDDCQVINLTDLDKVCFDMPPYPEPMYLGTGGVVDGTPIICGGRTSDADYLSSCYKFDPIIYSWIFLSDMTVPRREMASTAMNEALWITGGNTPNGDASSTEFVYVNGTLKAGPILPSTRDDHCMVTLHDGRIIILGSDGDGIDKKNSIIYDPSSNSFTDAPSLLYDRKGSACTLMYSSKDGMTPFVLVFGGEGTNTVEALDYTRSSEWIKGNNLFSTVHNFH